MLRARRSAAGGPSLRGQTTVAWRGLGRRDLEKRTRHAPLRGHVRVLVDYTTVQQQQSVTKCNTKYLDRWAPAHSPRLVAARPEVVSLGSHAWVLRDSSASSASLRGAKLQKHQLVSAFARISTHTIKADFSTQEDCVDLPTSNLKMRSGQTLKLKNPHRKRPYV